MIYTGIRNRSDYDVYYYSNELVSIVLLRLSNRKFNSRSQYQYLCGFTTSYLSLANTPFSLTDTMFVAWAILVSKMPESLANVKVAGR